jgi:hypothetical protein
MQWLLKLTDIPVSFTLPDSISRYTVEPIDETFFISKVSVIATWEKGKLLQIGMPPLNSTTGVDYALVMQKTLVFFCQSSDFIREAYLILDQPSEKRQSWNCWAFVNIPAGIGIFFRKTDNRYISIQVLDEDKLTRFYKAANDVCAILEITEL